MSKCDILFLYIGASIGSNHTGKAPDQELWPGEGIFFGLDCSIKFPANFSRSPYTLIATRVVTLPQKLEMPFSLINNTSQTFLDLSPAINEIKPGWVLSDNLYMIMRSEMKIYKRGLITANLPDICGKQCMYENEIFRPAIIELMLEARQRLEKVTCTMAKIHDLKGGAIYTDKQISGLGKNFMTESSRKAAVDTYSRFVLFYALRAMWRALLVGEHVEHIFTRTNDSRLNKNSVMNDVGTLVEEPMQNHFFNPRSTIVKFAATDSEIYDVDNGLRTDQNSHIIDTVDKSINENQAANILVRFVNMKLWLKVFCFLKFSKIYRIRSKNSFYCLFYTCHFVMFLFQLHFRHKAQPLDQ